MNLPPHRPDVGRHHALFDKAEEYLLWVSKTIPCRAGAGGQWNCGGRRTGIASSFAVGPTRRVFSVVDDYQAGPVSKQVVRIVMSYIDYVNRTVWYRA